MNPELLPVLAVFADEVKEGAAAAQLALQRLSAAPLAERKAIFATLCRTFHTWRGNSGMFGLSGLERVAQAMLDRVGPSRTDGVLAAERITGLVEGVKWVAAKVETMRATGAEDDAGSEELVAKI